MSVSHADSDNLLERWVLFLLLHSSEWTMQNCNKIAIFHNVKISAIPQVCRRGRPENAVSKYFCSICAQCVWLFFYSVFSRGFPWGLSGQHGTQIRVLPFISAHNEELLLRMERNTKWWNVLFRCELWSTSVKFKMWRSFVFTKCPKFSSQKL